MRKIILYTTWVQTVALASILAGGTGELSPPKLHLAGAELDVAEDDADFGTAVISRKDAADLVEIGAADWVGDPLDHDGDGEKGGSLPKDPPALTGKNKAQLPEIATSEGVAIPDGATVAQIVTAIEAKRAEA